ncbi:MAG: hypothetical protein A2X52_17115 [Candidatus Rokubacteria bacterium GWC2_70_16]|nr:MAG: hypothetical protein A2X52_17115 [Candidatus Rokubacteria bacterium GWC2_70_16]
MVHPQSTTSSRPVLRSEASMVSMSSGLSETGSITSAPMPAGARRARARSASCAMWEIPTMVTSSPSARTRARPKDTVYGGSGTGPVTPWSSRCSTNMTGLSSRMLWISAPLASWGVEGATTLRPGTCMNSACSPWECWAPCPQLLPMMERTTMGTETEPPDMYRLLAAMFTSWFMASSTKSIRICTWMGRSPASAAPMATPVIPSSQSGVLKTRSAPKRSASPRVVS